MKPGTYASSHTPLKKNNRCMKNILLLIIVLSFRLLSHAQMVPNLPIDPKVRSGVLGNGLSYYIVKNQESAGHADFFLMQKVGSILEEDNQRGLTHFLQHLAFSATENFRGNSLISYLETIGIKFGQNLGADTGTNGTIYNISSVPVRRETIIDSCLLILRDWSCAIALNKEDIDTQRGIIREKYKPGQEAIMRMYAASLPIIMPNTRYPYRLPIRMSDVIDNFSYNEITDYYRKWYRPDLQGVVIAGDVDPGAIEAKIKTLFGAIPKHENPALREEFLIPDNIDPLVSVASDPEFPSYVTMLMYKQPPTSKELRGTAAFLVVNFIQDMINSMLNSRFNEIGQDTDASFIQASASYGDFLSAQTKHSFSFTNIAKEGQIENSLRTIVRETQKLKHFGFTSSEYEIAKATYISRSEQLYNERDKQKNSFYTSAIQDHFFLGNAMPGIETIYTLVQQIVPAITLEQINQVVQSMITEDNVVILSLLLQKDGVILPTPEQMLNIYNTAKE